jgi:hypothetical protein
VPDQKNPTFRPKTLFHHFRIQEVTRWLLPRGIQKVTFSLLKKIKSYDNPFYIEKDSKKKYDMMNMVIGGVYFMRPEVRWEDVPWAREMEGDFETLGGEGGWKGCVYQ